MGEETEQPKENIDEAAIEKQMTEQVINAFMNQQSGALHDTLAAILRAAKENGYENCCFKIGEIEIDTTARPVSRVDFGFGTMRITVEDGDTTAVEKMEKIKELIKELVDMNLRPDKVLVPKEFDEHEEDTVRGKGPPMFM